MVPNVCRPVVVGLAALRAVAGLQAGDLIQSVSGQRVAELKDLQALLKTARDERLRQVILFVKRGIHTFFLELEPKWPEKQ